MLAALLDAFFEMGLLRSRGWLKVQLIGELAANMGWVRREKGGR